MYLTLPSHAIDLAVASNCDTIPRRGNPGKLHHSAKCIHHGVTLDISLFSRTVKPIPPHSTQYITEQPDGCAVYFQVADTQFS